MSSYRQSTADQNTDGGSTRGDPTAPTTNQPFHHLADQHGSWADRFKYAADVRVTPMLECSVFPDKSFKGTTKQFLAILTGVPHWNESCRLAKESVERETKYQEWLLDNRDASDKSKAAQRKPVIDALTELGNHYQVGCIYHAPRWVRSRQGVSYLPSVMKEPFTEDQITPAHFKRQKSGLNLGAKTIRRRGICMPGSLRLSTQSFIGGGRAYGFGLRRRGVSFRDLHNL